MDDLLMHQGVIFEKNRPVATASLWDRFDSEKKYNDHMSNPNKRQQLLENNWIDKEIIYRFNSRGFRTPEFTDKENFLVLGCSFTSGIGLPEEMMWANVISKLAGLDVWNLGVGGSGSDTCYRVADHYIPKLRPKYVIMLEPEHSRTEIFATVHNVGSQHHVIHGVGGWPQIVRPDIEYSMPILTDNAYMKNWWVYDENSQIRAQKCVQAIAYLCYKYRVEFYHYKAVDFTSQKFWKLKPGMLVDVARDLAHPGPATNQCFAKQVYEDIINKKTYD